MKDIYKTKLLESLIEIDRVCNENGLRYYLTGGTLLGAIRHKGFIPWDDDIDVAMPRPDYEQLKKIAANVFKKKFRFVTVDDDEKYYCRYAKVYHQETTLVEYRHPFYLGGLFVDVFPLDGMPTDLLQGRKHFTKYRKKLNVLNILYTRPKVNSIINLLRYVRQSIYKLVFNIYEQIKILDRIAQTYSYEDSEYIVNFSGAYGEREITKKEYFDEYLLTEFEGYKFRIPKGYHMLLKGLYGDYLQLPPKEKQVSHHSHYYLDLDKRLSLEEVKMNLKNKSNKDIK